MKNAHAALKTAIAAKGVDVPDGTKLTDMPALVEQIPSAPAYTSATNFYESSGKSSIVVPKTLVVDMMSIDKLTSLFYNCRSLTSLTLPDGFGQAATNLAHCFEACYNLTSLTLPAGFGQVAISIYGCFLSCKSLTQLAIPAGFGQNAKNIQGCFNECTSLTSLTLPTGFGQAAQYAQNCFTKCTALKTITGNPNFKVSFSLSDSTQLTHDSLMVVINGLQTVTTT